MRQRPAVDERGRDHRGAHARRREPVELLVDPVGIAQRQVRDGVEPAVALAHDGLAPPVPGPHVRVQRGQRAGELALPHQAVVREQDRLVEAELGEPVPPRRRVPVVPGERVVVPARRWLTPARGLVALAETGRVAGRLHLREPEPLVPPLEPRVAGLVVDEVDRVVALRRVGVVRPHPAVLDQVLVGIDDRAHQRPPGSLHPVCPLYCSAMIASNSASGSRCPVPETSTVTSWIVPVNRNGAA